MDANHAMLRLRRPTTQTLFNKWNAMEEANLAKTISEQVVSDTKFWIALIGIIGGIIGSALTVMGNIVFHWFKEKPQRDFENQRIIILTEMLDDDRFPEKWRNLATLSAVIGADDAETKRLLIKADARGSEKADGKWGLIKNHPFPGNE
ncbi:MAG: hypothetical protein LJE83_04520 [Gammaproteobacteria bacterium]|nr:hypothetical protein [Gammaproteobacteria bacterium]